MLNENYRKFVGGVLGGNTEVTGLTPYIYNNHQNNPLHFSASSWNTVTTPFPYAGNTSIYFVNGISIILGSGDIEPTVKDTQLASIIEDLTYVTGSTIQGTSDYNKLVSVTYKNNTANTITVKEVGLMMQETTSSGGYFRKALLGRVVLEAPVEMNPGDTYTFTYAIE